MHANSTVMLTLDSYRILDFHLLVTRTYMHVNTLSTKWRKRSTAKLKDSNFRIKVFSFDAKNFVTGKKKNV